MFASNPTLFLRRILAADAAACLGAGLFFVAGAETIHQWTALSASVLRGGGLVLLACAVFVAWLANRPQPPRALVWVVIAGNAFWALESLTALASGWLQPNALGAALVIAQAIAVAGIAGIEFIVLRKQVAPA